MVVIVVVWVALAAVVVFIVDVFISLMFLESVNNKSKLSTYYWPICIYKQCKLASYLERFLVVGGGLFGIFKTEHLLPDGLHRVGSGFLCFSRHFVGFFLLFEEKKEDDVFVAERWKLQRPTRKSAREGKINEQ